MLDRLQRHVRPGPRRALAAACMTLGGALAGCAASPPAQELQRTASAARLAMPGTAVLAFDRSPDGTSEPARFEFARRDRDLNATIRAPLQATREWPTPARPLERRIIFRRWVQY